MFRYMSGLAIAQKFIELHVSVMKVCNNGMEASLPLSKDD